MFTKLLKVVGSLAVVATLVLGLAALVQPDSVYAAGLDRGGPGGRGGQGAAPATSTVPAASTQLTDAEKSALSRAILEEYGALNLYNSVIAQFGSVTPFTQIARAEQQHINALVRQANLYGVAVPANPGLTSSTSFASLSAACQAGVDAEKTDAALYTTLKPSVSNTGLLQVFNNLQRASLNSHLPAFEACN